MQEKKSVKVVIAGGGTAGWLAAAALSKQLGPLLDITLVESSEIGTVGVGEATIPTMRAFHRLLGIDEQAFMRASQATFKLGVSFENWGQQGDRYIHSFGQLGKGTWMGEFHHIWLQAKARGMAGDLQDYCYELQAAEKGKFATSENAPINYAYHLDASLYALYLRENCETNGVRRIDGKINEVQQDSESGFITALVLDSGERIEGDLFIDCTGFKGLLIEKTLKAGFEDWGQWLPMDSALAVQTRATKAPLPYTRAISRKAAWQWEISLQHRVGNGLVFCSDHLSDDAAHKTLMENIQGEQLTEPRVIRFKTGRRRNSWVKNCVALGLSSGFVEPIESTSIHSVMSGITRLMKLFPFDGINESLVNYYNEQAGMETENIRDFIVLHYKLNQRSDCPFWQQCSEMSIPDSLQERIELFRENAQVYQRQEELFRTDSWVQVMLGQGLYPEGYHQLARLMSDAQMQQALGSLQSSIKKAVDVLPAHQDFVNHYCKTNQDR